MSCTYIIILIQFVIISIHVIETCFMFMFIYCFNMFAVNLCKSKMFSPQTFCLVLSNKTSFELN